MTDIDTILARLRDGPVDPRLDTIDSAVLDGVNRHLASRGNQTGGLFAAAALVALVTGILGAAASRPPSKVPNAFPLGASPALAPSTLLASAR